MGDLLGRAGHAVARARVAGREAPPGDVQREACSHEDLADAVVQLPRHAAAFLFLAGDHAAGQFLEPNVGEALLARVEEEAGAEHQREGGEEDAADDGDGSPEAGGRVGPERAHGRVHVLEEHARSDGPAPVLKAGDVGQRRQRLAGGGALPEELVVASARAGDADQLGGDRRAARVAQVGPVAADQLGPARRGERGAVVVEHEEVAVLAVEHGCKGLEDQGLGLFVVRPGIAVHGTDGGACEVDVVAELGALGGDQLLLDQPDLALGVAARLQHHAQHDGGGCGHEGNGSQKRELLAVAQPAGQAACQPSHHRRRRYTGWSRASTIPGKGP